MEANSVQDLKGSISLRAQETGSGFRVFFDDDDDEESYFDLNLEKMADAEDQFEFQISFSPVPVAGFSTQCPADELFRHGRILPLQGFQVVEARSLSVPSGADAHVHPAERLAPESPTPSVQATDQAELDARSSDDVRRPGGDLQHRTRDKKREELTRTRKASKKKTTKVNKGMKKFLIKFPSEKIRSTFTSIIKSYRFPLLQPKRDQGEARTLERGHMYKKLVTQFSRWLAFRKKTHNKSTKDAGTTSQRPSDVDIDEDFIRSILDAVDFAVGSRSWGANSSKGPREPYLSPRNAHTEMEGALERNNSINSAIAHCKLSYGDSAY